MRNHPDFHCDDQPALIADGLRKRTGRPWTHVHAKAWVTDNRDCLARGRGSDVATEGLAIFVAGPILSSNSVRLSEGRVGLACTRRRCPTSRSSSRISQRIATTSVIGSTSSGVLLPWTAQQGPGILMGDSTRSPTPSSWAGQGTLPGCMGRCCGARPRDRCRVGRHTAGSPTVAHRLRVL